MRKSNSSKMASKMAEKQMTKQKKYTRVAKSPKRMAQQASMSKKAAGSRGSAGRSSQVQSRT